jgi:hypothetical protein
MILGGGRTGYYIASAMEHRADIKIVEKDAERCSYLSQYLGKSLILHGDGTDQQLLAEENISDMEVFIAVTNNEELNIMASILAKKLGAKKSIAIVNKTDYIPLAHSLGLQAVLRPLFLTAFLLDDFLADNDFFGASQVLLSSASSKTAQGTAYCLARRRGTPGAPRIVGLTSAAHADFVRSLGCYDTVLTYDQLGTLEPHTPTVYVDFAGSAATRRSVHTHFADALTFSSSIGGTHWSALGSARDLPGPRPVLFFAPAQVKARSAPPPQGGGAAELQRRMGQAWAQFIGQVNEHGWVRIVTRPGAQAALKAYGEVLAGRADAREGLMLDMRG